VVAGVGVASASSHRFRRPPVAGVGVASAAGSADRGSNPEPLDKQGCADGGDCNVRDDARIKNITVMLEMLENGIIRRDRRAGSGVPFGPWQALASSHRLRRVVAGVGVASASSHRFLRLVAGVGVASASSHRFRRFVAGVGVRPGARRQLAHVGCAA